METETNGMDIADLTSHDHDKSQGYGVAVWDGRRWETGWDQDGNVRASYAEAEADAIAMHRQQDISLEHLGVYAHDDCGTSHSPANRPGPIGETGRSPSTSQGQTC